MFEFTLTCDMQNSNMQLLNTFVVFETAVDLSKKFMKGKHFYSNI